MARCGGVTKSSNHISASTFRQQADKLLAVMPDEKIVELYIKVTLSSLNQRVPSFQF